MSGAASSNRLIDVRSGRTTTWADLRHVDIPAPAAVVVDSSFAALPSVKAHAETGAEFLVVAAGRMEQALRTELRSAGFAIVDPDGGVEAALVPRPAQDGRLWLLTSGSTGRPKQIGHTLASLTTVSGDMSARTWLCPYSPGTYAWWQVVTLALGSAGQDLVVVDPSDLDSWVAAGIEYGVTAASGTPTFWRQTMMAHKDRLADVPLQQISLGGEPVDQAVLDQLRTFFPDARISWIYASSELGASIVVHDGRAGFPVEWLDRDAPDRPRLFVEGDELVISSPHHGAGLDGAVRTGDAVVIADGRVVITGRIDSDEINVGGAKVSAGVVRGVLTSHPDVAWAHVRGRKSPLVGNLVVAEVVLTSGETAAPEVVEALKAWSADRLPDYGVPRMIKLLEEIPAKETLKSDV
ncbi:MAG: Acyl-CoA synthetase (AMP-forming)/AMP-acid ligase II-like protein [Marmoricola sp.]|nr:Acyl-CoA synthetase (AMP-forming)/AMP-acid ligase II-like protein [Marmoricola sp.]